MTKPILLALAAAVLSAGSLQAQRTLVPGEPMRGGLSSSDPRLDDDTYYDEWAIEGRRGETVVVTMESDAFDSFLYLGTLRRGTFQELSRDDDGAGGHNARIEFQLPADGTYLVRTSSLARATGPYTVTLSNGQQTWEDLRSDRGNRERRGNDYLEPGRSVSGRLTSTDPELDNGAFFDIYRYEGRRGERLTINLRSTAFDAYLVLGTEGGRHGVENALARDDDGGGNRNSRIEFTLPRDGEYIVRVQSLLPASGAYTLELSSSLGGGRGGYDDRDEFDEGVDDRIVGRWGLTSPGARVQAGDWASISANSAFGVLTVDENGAYTWRKNGRLLRGQLVEITPRRNADAGMRYFVINDGRDEFYVFLTRRRGADALQMNGRTTDAVVAYGYADEDSRM